MTCPSGFFICEADQKLNSSRPALGLNAVQTRLRGRLMSYMEEIDLLLVWMLLVLLGFFFIIIIGTIGRVPICLIRPHMRK